jgi:hypothetical protein
MLGFDPNNFIIYNWLSSWKKSWISDVPIARRQAFRLALIRGYITAQAPYKITTRGVDFVNSYTASRK